MTVKITLACTECKQRNYNTTKNKKNNPGPSKKGGTQWQTKPIRSRALWPELRTP